MVAPMLPLLLLACTAGPPDDSGEPAESAWRAYGEGSATLSFASDDNRWDAEFTVPGYPRASVEAVAERLDQVTTPVMWLAWERGESGVLAASVDECAYETGEAPARHRAEVELWVPLGKQLAGVAADCADWNLEGVWVYVGWLSDPLSDLTAYTFLGQLGQYGMALGPNGATVTIDEQALDAEDAGSVRYEAALRDDFCGIELPAVEVSLVWDLDGPLVTHTEVCGG